jgi:uncharacterized cupredoxin-like copper-binding protein
MPRNGRRRVAAAIVAVALGLALGACSSDSTPKVSVKLGEYTIKPDVATKKTGNIEFNAENIGGTTHEFVIARADSAASVPTKPDGSVDEAKIPKADRIGEIEDVKPHEKKHASFDLAPGRYVFFCNVVDKSANPAVSHYAQGMYTTFTVSQ